MAENVSTLPRVVVGFDGSDPSGRALRWALRCAEAMGAVLEPVFAYGPASSVVLTPDSRDQELYRENLQFLKETIEAILEGASVRVEPRAIQGRAAEVLLEASKGAALLVVGTRGAGGFAGLRLGSVASHCVHHAHCPVTVVPGH